jgi:redox-sensitive bicupin YhaK (pirin superfamily)
MSQKPENDTQPAQGETDAVELVILGHLRDLGGLTVRRVLPSVPRRLVGPFIFFDHMGPVRFEPGHGVDVRPHPHINLATVTYLFEGELVHRDSLGFEQEIRAGDVNWMTAGRGIVHSERTSAEARPVGPSLHGIQSWVALPKSKEEAEPSFVHTPQSRIPKLERDGAALRLIAGTAYGQTSPVTVLSPMFYVEAILRPDAELVLPDEHEQRAAYVAEGTIDCEGRRHENGTMIVFRPGRAARVTAQTACRVMLLGGAPLDGARHIAWNFVSSSEERIEQAKRDWRAQLFPKVPTDDKEFIPLPE